MAKINAQRHVSGKLQAKELGSQNNKAVDPNSAVTVTTSSTSYGTPWYPTSIPSCSLWLDADDASSFTLVATPNPPASADFALASAGATATASSVHSAPFSPSKAIDGVTAASSLFISQQGTNEWLQIDFGQSRIIKQVVIWNRSSYKDRLDGYRLDFYTGSYGSGSIVHTISESPGNSWTSNVSTLTASINCRSIRLVNEDATQPQFLQVQEFQAFGPGDETNISEWRNKSTEFAGYFDLKQSNASNQPTYVTGVVNNKPVVRLDGTGSFMFSSGSTVYRSPAGSNDEVTIFYVFKYFPNVSPHGANYDKVLLTWGLNSDYDYISTYSTRPVHDANRPTWGPDRGIGAEFKHSGPTGLVALENTHWTTSPLVYSVRNVASGIRITGSGEHTYDYNNGLPGNSVFPNNASYIYQRMGVTGDNLISANEYVNGDVAEIICYARNLSDDEMATVETYLQNKWNITVATQSSDVRSDNTDPAYPTQSFFSEVQDNCSLWADFTDTTKVKTTGSDPGNEIYRVEDKSRKNSDPVQNTPSQYPHYLSTEGFGLNNLPSLSGKTGHLDLDQVTSYGVSWSPLNIPSCTLWLDANDASSMTLSGTNISQWNDKSGNGNHVGQSTSTKQPTYLTASSLFGNRPVVKTDSDGSTHQFLTRSSTTDMVDVSNHSTTFFVLAQYASHPSVYNHARWFMMGFQGENTNGSQYALWFHQNNNGQFVQNYYGSTYDVSLQGIVPADILSGSSSIITGRSYSSGTELRITGTLGKLKTSGNPTIDADGWIIVGDQQQGGKFHIAEYINYNRGLTDAECATVETYLQNKWGITVATQSSGVTSNNFDTAYPTSSIPWTVNSASTVYGVFRKYENSGEDYLLSYGEKKIRTSGSNLQWVGTGDAILQASSSLSTYKDYIVTVSEEGQSFSPLNIPSCSLWLDADDASSITLNGSTVSQWNNKANHLTTGLFNYVQSNSSYQPTYVTGALNGRALVRFDGSIDGMDSSGSVSVPGLVSSGNNDYTLFYVISGSSGQGTTTILATGYSSAYVRTFGSTAWLIFIHTDDLKGTGWYASDGTSFTYDALAADNRLFTYINSGSTGKIFATGTLHNTNTDVPNLYPGDTANHYSRLGYGYRSSGTDYRHFEGDIAEIIFYEGVLSDTDRTTVETYLQNKWGITVATQSAVPYGTSSIYLNGVLEQHSTSSISNDSTVGAIAGSGSSDGNFAGNIGEIVMYDPAVTSYRNRKKVERYLADKYNINYTGFQPDQITASIDATGNSKSKLVLWLDASDTSTITEEEWSPLNIPSCSLWLDADDASTITREPSYTNWADASNGTTAQSNSIYGSHSPSNAIDGYIFGDFFHSQQGTNEWLQIDFGQSRNIDKVVIWSRSAYYSQRMDGYRLDFYTGSYGSGSVVHTISESPGSSWTSNTSILTASINCRSIRLVNEDATQPQFTEVQEFQAFGDLGSTAKVSQWDDKSGNGNHYGQTTSNAQPAYSASAINGRDVVAFTGDAALQTLTRSATTDYADSNNKWTTFLVVNQYKNHGGANATYIGYNYGIYFSFGLTNTTGTEGNQYIILDMRGNDGANGRITIASYGSTYDNDMDINQATEFIGVDKILTARMYTSGTEWRITGSFGQIDTSTGYNVNENGASLINAFSTTNNVWGVQYYAEIIHYNRGLTDAECATVETYLQNKWGITVATQSDDYYEDIAFNWSSKVDNITATQTGSAYKPTTGSINGKNMVLFSGSTYPAYLEITGTATASLDFVAGTDSYTIFSAFQRNSGSNYGTILSKGSQYALSYNQTDNLIKSDFGSNAVSGTDPKGSTFHLASSLTSPTLNKIYVTGTLAATGAIATSGYSEGVPVRVGAGSSFSPLSIPSCSLWLDADDASTVILNGADVLQWQDKSGKGNHFGQHQGYLQPLYATASNEFAPRSGIRMTGSSTMWLTASTTTDLGTTEDGADQFTIFTVVNQYGVGNNAFQQIYGFGRTSDGSAGSYYVNLLTEGGDLELYQGAGPNFYFSWDPNAGDNIIVQRSNAAGSTLRVTGTVEGTSATKNTNFAGTGHHVIGYSFGGRTTSHEYGEMIVYNRGLTDAEITTVETYLQNKWNITVATQSYTAPENQITSGAIGEILVYTGSLTDFERKHVEEYLYDKWEIVTSASY